jgi:hypothetical protein
MRLEGRILSDICVIQELQDDAPLLYLACTDMEMSHGSKTRALYILCHFGAGIPYTPSPSNVDDPVSRTLILKAKLGFQQHLQNVRRGRTYIRDTASFSSKPVFEESLAFTLPGIISAFTFVVFLCFEKKLKTAPPCESPVLRRLFLMIVIMY